MEHLIAFLGGVSAKLYDDLHDNKLIEPLEQEILKGTQWMSLTLLSHSDFNFTIVNYIMNVLNGLGNPEAYSPPYEKSLLILYPVLLLISFHTMTSFGLYDWICIVWFITSMALEPLLIKEEFSCRKLFIRLSTFIVLLISVYAGMNYGVSNSIIKLLIYGMGYMLTSSFFQAYLLYNQKLKSNSEKELTIHNERSKVSYIPSDDK